MFLRVMLIATARQAPLKLSANIWAVCRRSISRMNDGCFTSESYELHVSEAFFQVHSSQIKFKQYTNQILTIFQNLLRLMPSWVAVF